MLIVFTDLDGTLLDHDTYSFDAARPALAALKESNSPLVLASSKTEAEMRPLAEAIGTTAPLIVENGAGIVDPTGNAPDTQTEPCYDDIRSMLAAMPQQLRRLHASFGDWTAAEIAQRTGLTPHAAELARTRRYSEPGIWSGSDAALGEFRHLLDDAGYQAVAGGRFLTIMPKTSKAKRIAEIIAQMEKSRGETATSIALGDGMNDLEMLQTADLGIIVANPNHPALPVTAAERAGRIRRTEKPGPEGWNEAVLSYLVETGLRIR